MLSYPGMEAKKTDNHALKCYIAAFQNPTIDSYLENNGFARGLMSFAVPTYGILFRCRTEGRVIDLEFAALFALLKFLKTKLEAEKIKNVQILSSNPELVFSFTGNTPHLKSGTPRRVVLDEFTKDFQIAIGYIKPSENKALVSPADYPSMPANRKISLRVDTADHKKAEFKPFQKGIKL